MKIREAITLIESAQTTPADLYVEEAEAALAQFGSHIDATLFPKAARVVEIHEIIAEPMRQGWGTKAMNLLTQLADQHGITLVLEVANGDDGDDWSDDGWSDSEDDETGDESVSDNGLPSEGVLISFYEGFDFETRFSMTGRTQMLRKPKAA